MKKILMAVAAAALLFGFVVLREKNDASKVSPEAVKVIKVASHNAPMTTVVEIASEEMKKEGYKVELVKVTDNVQANVALKNKEVDANFFQHKPFMELFNQKNDAKLVSIQTIYDALLAFYSKKYKSIDELPEGAKIAIPDDPSNQSRALRILEHHKLISINKDAGKYSAAVKDITENSKGFQFQELNLLNLVSAYDEADMIFNYPSYMNPLQKTPVKDSLLMEEPDGHFAISLVVRDDNKDNPEIAALKKAMTSQAVYDFLVKENSETLKPAFEVSK